MPAKEIKELRQQGKLEDAMKLAKTELQAEPENIWAKRNISWVYYDYIKINSLPEKVEEFIYWIDEIKKLELPNEERMLFDQLCWQVGKMAFILQKSNPPAQAAGSRLFDVVKSIHFTKPSEGYSFLFKGLHKLLKETDLYIQFADWWDFSNFLEPDFDKEKMPDGKEIMSIVEQAYIVYAKHLLPKTTISGEVIFDRSKIEAFLPSLNKIVEDFPHYQYPGYFISKLLLALGDKNNMLASLLPFAKKKRNDFWVWDAMAEAFSKEPDKVLACYCRALSCRSPQEMLISLRQKMAKIFISMELYNEAKTEIELLVKARTDHAFNIPQEVLNWQKESWYQNSNGLGSNADFYNKYSQVADSLLFSDVKEEFVIVEFVNSERKILNFIASEGKYGFFKYERFFPKVKVGDILKVRFNGGSNEGIFHVYTAFKTENEAFKSKYLKIIDGVVKITEGKNFGFIEEVYIHPSLVRKYNLSNGSQFNGQAVKTFNKEKAKWTWKLI